MIPSRLESGASEVPTLRLALTQMLVEPGRPAENLARAAARIASAAEQGAEIVLLPEALDCGWTHPSARELAGAIPDGPACAALRAAAVQHRVWVCAGLVERAGDRLFNAAVLVAPDGALRLHHRKIHELDFACALYAQGDRLAVTDTPWGRVGVMICADAFAPGLPISRALGAMGARLILSPCAWAVPPGHDNAREPYGKLWRDSYGPVAREHGLWIAGCSHVGPVTAGEWRGWRCIGCSLVVGPDGRPRAEGPYDAEALLRVELPVGK